MFSQRKPPRIIPVLDVMNGQVVRAIAGRRDEYRPVESKLTASTDPVEVAKALLAATGADALYVADLDAITGADRAGRAVTALAEQCGCRLFADVGVRRKADFARVPRLKNVVPVLGCETLAGPDAALAAGFDFLSDWAFSLDLFRGRLLGDWSAWGQFGVHSDADAWEMAAAAVMNCGAGMLILIDLANVGTGTGAGTEYWCRKIRATLPEVQLIAGGGVRTWGDVERLGEAGASGVLTASALHDGTLVVPSTC
jgi:phosphoribosylformimino-5-aminoimidazole carboxamide ribotide isomerase